MSEFEMDSHDRAAHYLMGALLYLADDDQLRIALRACRGNADHQERAAHLVQQEMFRRVPRFSVLDAANPEQHLGDIA